MHGAVDSLFFTSFSPSSPSQPAAKGQLWYHVSNLSMQYQVVGAPELRGAVEHLCHARLVPSSTLIAVLMTVSEPGSSTVVHTLTSVPSIGEAYAGCCLIGVLAGTVQVYTRDMTSQLAHA